MMNKLINIFVLDDDPFMLKLLDRMLAKLGYGRVSCFDSGAAVLAACETPDCIPDVILLDINMPSMDGIEFVRHLAERCFIGTLILISGEDERMLAATNKLVRSHRLSVLGTLRKPFTLEGLSALLDKWAPHVVSKPCAASLSYDAEAVHAAIANGELINYYQPKVAVATGEVVGVETLVRWQHPLDGLVLPDSFIPVAEAHGLTSKLTRVVLKEALLQSKIWQAEGLYLRVAVNVSMDDLADVDFADFVATEASGLPPQSLILEVTESSLIQNFSAVLDVCARLHMKRFCLSIDDFGTGHSSLVQLHDLPFDELKIAQIFTHNACRDARQQAIFKSSLDLALQLGMEVVAEGVENANDWAYLRTTQCHIAQGYFIARPMPAAALPGWIDEWQHCIATL
jgi:EAL domain-containing protein (putative c-di-GMP-specific phosphodiesterase class I)/FixJ family two-component response regulator